MGEGKKLDKYKGGGEDGGRERKSVEKAKWRWICKEFGVTKPEKLPCQQWEMGSLRISIDIAIHQFRKGRKMAESVKNKATC